MSNASARPTEVGATSGEKGDLGTAPKRNQRASRCERQCGITSRFSDLADWAAVPASLALDLGQ